MHHVRTCCAVVALAAASAATAQQITLQKTNSISLSSNFFGANEDNQTPGSDYGTSPLSIGFDGTNAYVGGYHSDSSTLASNRAGIVQVAGILGMAPSVNPIAGSVFDITQNSRGIDAITLFGGDLFFMHDRSSGGDFIRRMTPAGNTVWQIAPPEFQRAAFLAIDPVGDSGQPALGFFARGSGRLQALRLSDGAHIATQSGGSNPGPIYDPFPSTIGYSQRGMFFDSVGNLAYSAANGVGVSLRTAGGTFTNLANIAGTTRSIIKGTPIDNVGNGVAMLDAAGAEGLQLLVFSARLGGDATIGFSGTLTSSTGVVQPYDARFVQLRNLDGNDTGLVQTQLLGDEDGIGTQYSGEVKNFAAATDAAGNPVLLVLSFADRRLDVYQLEPTWTNPAGGTWDAQGNWFNSTRPDSALLNARFGSAITSNAAVTLTDPRTTKNLKFDNASASYTLSGATITIAAPTGVRGQITNLSGNHTVNNPISLTADTEIRVNGDVDTLTLAGGLVAGTQSLTKLGGGTAAVQRVHTSAGTLTVAAGTLAVIPNGGNDGASLVQGLVIADDGAGSFTARMDLSNNGLVLHGGPIPVDEIVAGRGDGSWTGNGLTSSTAAASPTTSALGYAVAGDVGISTFFGISVQASDGLVRYTRLGDSNLNGTTEIGDFALLAANFNSAGTWRSGDYNYDGQTDIGDFALLAANFNQSVADLPRAVVPEPAAGLLLTALAASALRRRRILK